MHELMKLREFWDLMQMLAVLVGLLLGCGIAAYQERRNRRK